MNEVAESPLAGSTSSVGNELARLALDYTRWSKDGALTLADGLPAAYAALRARETPLNEVEPMGGVKTSALKKAIGMLGVKISPTMSRQQSNTWASTMVLALSDLPAAFVLCGAKDALHVPMQFISEIEGVVREKAAKARERHHSAIMRLRRFERDLEYAKNPTPALPAPEPREMTQDDINTMLRPLLNMGLAQGWITQEQFDIATGKDETDDRGQ